MNDERIMAEYKAADTAAIQAALDAMFANLRHELKTQDNQITADPLFVVYERIRITGIDTQYGEDGFFWYDSENCEETDDLNSWAYYINPEKSLEEQGIEKVFYRNDKKFVSAHLTRKSAEDFIKRRNHDYPLGLFIYVDSMCSGSDIKDLRNIILGNEDDA